MQRRLLQRNAEMRDLEKRRSACTADLAKRVSGKVDPERVIMYHNYLNLLSGRMQKVGAEIARLNNEVRDKTNEVIAASKGKKIVERIRERDMIAFNKLLADTERKVLDEVGANRASAVRADASVVAAQRIG